MRVQQPVIFQPHLQIKKRLHAEGIQGELLWDADVCLGSFELVSLELVSLELVSFELVNIEFMSLKFMSLGNLWFVFTKIKKLKAG